MTNPKATDILRSPARKHAKVSLQQAIQVAFNFSQGLGVEVPAKATGLSRKTVRDLYIDYRRRLKEPRFNRWHKAKYYPAVIPTPYVVEAINATFFDVLADCYFNEPCYRNYRLGNRKNRLCRKCPVPSKFSAEENAMDAIAALDQTRAFYEHLGIRGEKGADKLVLLRERLIHAGVVHTALANSKKLLNGLADPRDDSFLSVRTLAEMLIDDLAGRSP